MTTKGTDSMINQRKKSKRRRKRKRITQTKRTDQQKRRETGKRRGGTAEGKEEKRCAQFAQEKGWLRSVELSQRSKGDV